MKIRGQAVIPPKDRILKRVFIGVDGCWEWQGVTKGFGYGYLTVGSRTDGTRLTVSAHRYSYEAFIGSIPEGLYVLHKCDNPKCVNPDHLFLGTHQDNINDREAKGRNNLSGVHKKGEEHPNSKLTWEDVQFIRNEPKVNGYISALADRFGVSHRTISDVVNMNTWLPEPPTGGEL